MAVLTGGGPDGQDGRRKQQQVMQVSSLIDCGPNRTFSRSVSWSSAAGGNSSSSSTLAFASSDHSIRVWTIDPANSNGTETASLTGHTAPVTRVRYHPADPSQLCSASKDSTVRLWDVRSGGATQRNKVDDTMGSVSDVQWNRRHSNLLVVTDIANSKVSVYDARKLQKAAFSITLRDEIPEVTIFDPVSGDYLISGASHRETGMASLMVMSWKNNSSSNNNKTKQVSYPAHSGPIYGLAASNDGKQLLTGGADAVAILWDVQTMCPTASVARCTKFLRGVAFSSDSKLIGLSSEEDSVLIASSRTGESVGLAALGRPRAPGAEEIEFAPAMVSANTYLLACARAEGPLQGPSVAPVTVMKVTVSS
jgi:WD40 repeat protein